MRSLRNRLAVVFGLIVLGAIATVYLSTVPRLEDRLTDQKLVGLEADAQRAAPELANALLVARNDEGKDFAKRVTATATRASAQLIVMTPLRGSPAGLSLFAESTTEGGVRSGQVSRIALQAAESRTPQKETTGGSGGRQALVAEPLLREKKVVGVVVF